MNAAQARALSEDHSDQSYLAMQLREFVLPLIEKAARRGHYTTPYVLYTPSAETIRFLKRRLTTMGYTVTTGVRPFEDARKEMVISW